MNQQLPISSHLAGTETGTQLAQGGTETINHPTDKLTTVNLLLCFQPQRSASYTTLLLPLSLPPAPSQTLKLKLPSVLLT